MELEDHDPHRRESQVTPNGMHREQSLRSNSSQRDVLRIALHDTAENLAVTPALVAAIREICAEAQTRSQGPERSLVEFKLSLTDAANEVEIPPGPDRNNLLDGLVSKFIEEFYRPAVKAGGAPRAFDCGDVTQAAP
jgi:hypothetical protein